MTIQLAIGSQNREGAKSTGVSYAPDKNEGNYNPQIGFAETFDNRTDGIWLRKGVDSIWKGGYGEERLYSSTSKVSLTPEQIKDIARRIVNFKSAISVRMADGQMRVLQAEDRIAKHFR